MNVKFKAIAVINYWNGPETAKKCTIMEIDSNVSECSFSTEFCGSSRIHLRINSNSRSLLKHSSALFSCFPAIILFNLFDHSSIRLYCNILSNRAINKFIWLKIIWPLFIVWNLIQRFDSKHFSQCQFYYLSCQR